MSNDDDTKIVDAVPTEEKEPAAAPAQELAEEVEAAAENPPLPSLITKEAEARRILIDKFKEHNASIKDVGSVAAAATAKPPSELLVRNLPDILAQKGIENNDEVARNILDLDRTLFQDLESQLESAGIETANIAKYAAELKRGFFEVIAGGHLNSEDINSLLSGRIRIHPADAGTGTAYEAVCSISFDPENGPTLNIYRNFFARKKNKPGEARNDQAHLIKHELGHVIEVTAMGHDEYGQFVTALSNPEQAGNLPSELQMILDMLGDPAAAAGRERNHKGHLANRLNELADAIKDSEGAEAFRLNFNDKTGSSLTAEQCIMKYKLMLAKEILAERIANYLESDGTVVSYIHRRFGKREGDISEAQMVQEKAFFDFAKGRFDEKESWDSEFEGGWFDDLDFDLNEESFDPLAAGQSKGGNQDQSLFGKFFDWLTGQKPKTPELPVK